MDLIVQIIIALITTSLGSILAYFKAIKDSNTKIEAIKINADNEIQKIREESQKELNRIKTENEESIKAKMVQSELDLKEKEETLKYEAMGSLFQQIINDPKKAGENIKSLQNLAQMFPNNK